MTNTEIPKTMKIFCHRCKKDSVYVLVETDEGDDTLVYMCKNCGQKISISKTFFYDEDEPEDDDEEEEELEEE